MADQYNQFSLQELEQIQESSLDGIDKDHIQ